MLKKTDESTVLGWGMAAGSYNPPLLAAPFLGPLHAGAGNPLGTSPHFTRVTAQPQNRKWEQAAPLQPQHPLPSAPAPAGRSASSKKQQSLGGGELPSGGRDPGPRDPPHSLDPGPPRRPSAAQPRPPAPQPFRLLRTRGPSLPPPARSPRPLQPPGPDPRPPTPAPETLPIA